MKGLSTDLTALITACFRRVFRLCGISVSVSVLSMVRADAGVFGMFALATNLSVIIDAEILWLCVGGLPYLDDKTVPVPFGKGFRGSKSVAGFLEIECDSSRGSFRDHLNDLLFRSDWLHAFVIKSDANFLVRLHKELGMQRPSFEYLPPSRAGHGLVVVIVCGKGSGDRDCENGQDGLSCFHGEVGFGRSTACAESDNDGNEFMAHLSD